ncbi:hypothetical protein OG975_24960 [Streptomyces sp. NBC_00203]
MADADGLGGAQVALRDLRHDDAAPTPPAPDVVDRAEGCLPPEFARGYVIGFGRQKW